VTKTKTLVAGIASIVVGGGIIAAPPTYADVAPQYPPGRYNVETCEDMALTNCPEPNPRVWEISDGGPGVIRVQRVDPGATPGLPPFDLRRMSNGWEAEDDGAECTDNGNLVAEGTRRMSLSDENVWFQRYYYSPEFADCETDDPGDFLKVTPA